MVSLMVVDLLGVVFSACVCSVCHKLMSGEKRVERRGEDLEKKNGRL